MNPAANTFWVCDTASSYGHADEYGLHTGPPALGPHTQFMNCSAGDAADESTSQVMPHAVVYDAG